jgi:hypothetical protein
MAEYSIISDVSSYIVKMLRDKMCPEPVPSPNNIEVSTPADQDVDYILGLYLYDIAEELEMGGRPPLMPTQRKTMLKKPPRPYSLHYMLFINGSSQMGLKAHDIQKILGRAAQVVSDGGLIFPRQLQPWLTEEENPIIISPARMSLDEKIRVWSSISKPYQVSLFYKASPVLLSSEVVVETPLVTDATFNIDMG